MTGRIQELRDKLHPLAAREAELHLESHQTCHFEAGGKYIVDDEARLDDITKELETIAAERAKILDKVARLEELLGKGCQDTPTGYENMDYIGRLKMELSTFFIYKILAPGNGDAFYTLPEKGILDERYVAKKAKILPEIEKLEAGIIRGREEAAAAQQILYET